MNSKRIRSFNWDDEEKQLLRTVLKEYAPMIENKSLDTNTIKKKNKAWEEVTKKFNELNRRPRQLSQLKIQWKVMKINARKTCSAYKKDANKTGGGARPTTPNDALLIMDILNPAERLRDHNADESDGIISEDDSNLTTPLKTNMGPIPANNVFQRKVTETGLNSKKDQNENARNLIGHTEMLKDIFQVFQRKVTETGLKSKKQDQNENARNLIGHTEMLKDKEHMRRMEMAEEEHAIKMAIYSEKLKSAILERDILELKKKMRESSED